MAAFQFPDPAVETTVVNPITGSTYQWKEPPGKWVIVTKVRDVGDIIWEGDSPPDPIGDYKLWYSTDTLELYFYYCDANNVCAWVPTSAPITMLEDLDAGLSELKADVYKINIATAENENAIGRTIYFGDTAPPIYEDVEVITDIVDVDGETVIGQNTEYFPNELNYKFWFDDSRLELLILFKDADGDYSYVPVSIPLESLPEPGVSQEMFSYTTNKLQEAIYINGNHNLNQDAAIDEIKNDIIELEEEIEALAPSLERGNWNYKQILENRAYSLFDTSGQFTDMFNNVGSIYVSTIDADGNPHGFDDVVTGSYIEIFNNTNADFGLYLIKDIDDKSNMNPGYWVFTVDFIKSNRLPSKAIGLARFKFFEAPSGGDASEFVKKTGDEMTGQLTLSGSDALNLKGKIQVNGTTTSSRFLGTDSNGNTSWKTALTSHIQADWNTTNSSSASYIKNKPSIPSAPTYTITKNGGNYYVS